MINPRAAGFSRPVPVAASSQVYVVSPSQPNLVATGGSLEVEEVAPRIRSTVNWVLSTSDVGAHVGAGTLRGAAGTLRGHPSGLLQEGAGNEVVLLYTPTQELSPTVVLQGAQNIDMAISNFHIKFDNKDKFKPGDEISGKVQLFHIILNQFHAVFAHPFIIPCVYCVHFAYHGIVSYRNK